MYVKIEYLLKYRNSYNINTILINMHNEFNAKNETALKILDKNRQTLYTCFFLKSFKDKISISIEQ